MVAMAVLALGSGKLTERAGRWLKLVSGAVMLRAGPGAAAAAAVVDMRRGPPLERAAAMSLKHRVAWLGRVAGPLLALALYLALPRAYVDAAGQTAPLGHAARATFAMMVLDGRLVDDRGGRDRGHRRCCRSSRSRCSASLPLSKHGRPTARTSSSSSWAVSSSALAIQRWGLDRRIAFFTLRLVGARPGAIVGGFMAGTAFLSMWVSNTATAAMMVPIALSVIDLVLRAAPAPAGGRGGIPQDRIP